MTDLATWRLRYAQVFISILLCISFYMSSQAIQGGIAKFDSQLPGKKNLISLFARLRLKLGDHVFNNALVGKNGWLEYTGNMDSFQNPKMLSDKELQSLQSNLERLYRKLSAKNITLILVIAPDKTTIYPDKLPDQIKKINSESDLDLLKAYLTKYGPPVLLDLRPALLQARKKQDIYYRTDTHWNYLGGYLAYREIMDEIAKTYPDLKPIELDKLKLTRIEPTSHDLPLLFGVTNILEDGFLIENQHQKINWVSYNAEPINWVNYNGEKIDTLVATTAKNDAPRLLMYKDSFGRILTPLIAGHFSQATFISNLSAFPDTLTSKEIDVVLPDIVIVEFVERYIPLLNDFIEKLSQNKP